MERRTGDRERFTITLSERDAVLFESGTIQFDMSGLRKRFYYQRVWYLRWLLKLFGKPTVVEQVVELQDAKIRESVRMPDGRMQIDLDCTPVLISEEGVKE